MPACAFFGEKASARRCASDAQRGLGEAGFWGVALRLLRGSRSLRWAWQGFGAVARRGFVTVSMGFWRIGTGRGIAARPHLDRHYLSEFLLVVFLGGTWLVLILIASMLNPKYEMGVGENGSSIGGNDGWRIRMLRVAEMQQNAAPRLRMPNTQMIGKLQVRVAHRCASMRLARRGKTARRSPEGECECREKDR